LAIPVIKALLGLTILVLIGAWRSAPAGLYFGRRPYSMENDRLEV